MTESEQSAEIYGILQDLSQGAKLCDLPSAEFEPSGSIWAASTAAGYAGGTSCVNNLDAWNMTVSEFAELITA